MHQVLNTFYDFVWTKNGDIEEIITPKTQLTYEVTGDFTRLYSGDNLIDFLKDMPMVNYKYFKIQQSFNQIVVEYFDGTKRYTDTFTVNRNKIVTLKMTVE